MSKIAALRDLLVALLLEHERDGTIPLMRGSCSTNWCSVARSARKRPACGAPIRTCTTR